jgi:hypothetical protein
MPEPFPFAFALGNGSGLSFREHLHPFACSDANGICSGAGSPAQPSLRRLLPGSGLFRCRSPIFQAATLQKLVFRPCSRRSLAT